jgi:CheY-like chemotaxis protein
MIQTGGVDIVLIDFNMPGIDGVTMAASIRATDSRMPIAMVSANIQEEIIARARQLSVAFVPKPIMNRSAHFCLAQLFGSGRQPDAGDALRKGRSACWGSPWGVRPRRRKVLRHAINAGYFVRP